MATAKKTTKKKTNPNGANQHKVDPRQALFISYYLDPKSETFANGLQSALRAGYEQSYAVQMVSLMPDWLQETTRDSYIVERAERNLQEFLDMNTINTVGDGDEAIVKDDPQLKRIKADMTKFALERLNKKKYSSRTEHTGKDGAGIKLIPLLGGDSAIREDNSDREATPTQEEN